MAKYDETLYGESLYGGASLSALEFKTSTAVALPEAVVANVRKGTTRGVLYGEPLFEEAVYGALANLDDFLPSLLGTEAADASVRGR